MSSQERSSHRAFEGVDNLPKKYVEAPYHYDYKQNETVSLNSGALQLSYKDIVLPGKNGFDLVVERVYDSSAAGSHYPLPEKDRGSMYCQEIYRRQKLAMKYMYFDSRSRLKDQAERNGFDEDNYNLYFVYKIDQLKTIGRENNHFNNVFGLGFGWRFNFPSIECIEPTEIETLNKQQRGSMYLHLDDGRSIHIKRNYDDRKWELDDYKEHDISVSFSSGCTVTYRNGRIVYFSGCPEYGFKLSYIKDKFGNRISFDYTADKRLKKITDTFGRVIELKEAVDSKDSSKKILYWQRQDSEDILFKYTVQDNQLIYARQVVNQSKGGMTERVTSFSYTPQIANTTLFWEEKQSGDEGIEITYYNLTGITHPSGARTEYSYTTLEKRLESCMRGKIVTYAISSRRDRVGSSIVHGESYSYHVEELDLSEERKEEVGYEAWGAITITSASASYTNNGRTVKKVVSNFDGNNGLLDNELTYHYKSGLQVLVKKRSITYKNKLPVSEVITTYNPDNSHSMTKTLNWSYDSKDNVSSYKETYPHDSGINQNVKMQYDQAYSLMLEKTTENTNGNVRETYHLSSDKKLVTAKLVYENEILKERTEYEYYGSSDGLLKNMLKKEKRYYGENLLNSTSCYVTEYCYGNQSPEPTEIRVTGVCDADGNPVKPTNAQDESGTIVQTFTYDWFGRVTKNTDGNGNATLMDYDGIGRPVKESHSKNGQVSPSKTTEYDDKNNQILLTNEEGNQTKNIYTPLGKIERQILVNSDETEVLLASYEYDQLERVTKESIYMADGSIKLITNYTYDLYGQMSSKTIQNASGEDLYKETYVFVPVVKSIYFSMTKTIVGEETSAPSIITETLTDQAGNVRQETVKGSESLEDAVIHYTYDKVGNKLTKQDALGNVTSWEYDYANRVVKETNAEGKTNQTYYDALSNKVKTTNPAGNSTLFTYDALGRLLLQESPFDGDAKAVVRYFYDAGGNVLRQETLCSAPGEPEVWRKTAYQYDSRNRVTDTILYAEDGSENRTRYEYDNVGNKTAVYMGIVEDSVDDASKMTYTYDRFKNVLTMVDARSNKLSPTDELYRVEHFDYNSTGRLLSKTDRNGSKTQYTYDALNRLLTENVTAENPSGSLTSERVYSYTKTGQKRSEQNDTVTVKYSYDSMGRLMKQSELDGTIKEYAYDANGNRISFVLTRNNKQEISLTYIYDHLNRLTEVRKEDKPIAKYYYDDNGNRRSLEYPENNILTTYRYNDANLVVSLENTKEGKPCSSFQYTYYLDGNQKEKTEQDGTVTSYLYDSMGRLKQESESGGKTIAYIYDRFSNRSQMTVSDKESYVTSYEYHPNNWLLKEEKRQGDTVETTRYRYDANGNQVYRDWEKVSPDDTEIGDMKFLSDEFLEDVATLETREYNGFNQLVSVYRDGENIVYRYRPDGLRYGKTVRGLNGETTQTVHIWDGQNIVADAGANEQVNARYLRGINLIVRELDGKNQYYLFNAHGDVVQRADGWGNVLKTYRYDAFGNEQNLEKLDSNPFRYCGEYFDKETGEIYLRARYYNPTTGRFGAEDSARSGLNWYTYCGNNPVSFYDPTGCYYTVEHREKIEGKYHTSYKVVQDSEMAAFVAGALSYKVKVVGGTLAKKVIWGIFNDRIIGGTSVQSSSLGKELFKGTLEEAASMLTGGAYGFFGALKSFAERDEIALQDAIYFGIMNIANLPDEFKNLDDLNKQMSMLESYVKANPDYFTGIGGESSGAQFFDDYMLYKMSPQRRQRFLMDQAGLDLFEIYNPEKYPDKAGWSKYRELTRGYNQRIGKIRFNFSK